MDEKINPEFEEFSKKFESYWKKHLDRLKIVMPKKLKYNEIFDLLTLLNARMYMTTREAEKKFSTIEHPISKTKVATDWNLGKVIFKDLLSNQMIKTYIEVASVESVIRFLEFLLKNNIPVTESLIEDLRNEPIKINLFDNGEVLENDRTKD